MKCPHCGAQIGLEEKYCPFCGLPNEFARKHQEDMDRYEQEFQQTQSEVYQKTRHFMAKEPSALTGWHTGKIQKISQ